MTDSAPKPKRSRWRWLAAVIVLASLVSFLGYRSNRSVRIEAATHAWIRKAAALNLVCMSDTVCVIPGLEYHELGRRVLGQRKVRVAVYNAEDAHNLGSMPPFPVKLVVDTLASTPPDVVTMLRSRFPHVQ
ncbi:hypothetical protein Pan44_53190 [Caulifigura coniformis]|uniref:Uncharacterized protein n=1 Tax=Caulifigura coniformis TaxID=2527983 RepID=A0A517SM99_9PLAN|nr:hypothetical protein [Caulifigura coniformis]QDT57251.1 hypothetical protein Pan44_53190 [Caulifigura coniformis]